MIRATSVLLSGWAGFCEGMFLYGNVGASPHLIVGLVVLLSILALRFE